ncbi:sigma-54-dependent Fis family transcriptional regulator [bacterium]|nr:sigma-54-dependent Fis family transcriptional regulator [bacterium]MCP5461806.1 sigma-54-dependent Fis family transcriptional regulator [bacterium]
MDNKILLVDDNHAAAEVISILLEALNYQVSFASDGVHAMQKLNASQFDLVISDLCMPNMDGMELLKHIKDNFPDIEVIITTAYVSIDTAISAMKMGAYDYLTKPMDDMERVRLIIDKALDKVRIQRENRRLRSQLQAGDSYYGILGKSKRMRSIFSLIDKVAASDTSVLVQGESGTGKELIARAIHAHSPRRNNNLVPVDCGSLPRELLESELFGHMKGSFSGAVADKKGLFEHAHGGTLFLDEISSTDHTFQAKLLRALQEKEIRRVGSTHRIPIDIRLVAASNKDLRMEVHCERFRKDLFYRINIMTIEIPPLRERTDDLPLLCTFFLNKYSTAVKKEINGIDEKVMRIFEQYAWPGNVRELENVIERAVILTSGTNIGISDLPAEIMKGNDNSMPHERNGLVFADAKELFERNYLIELLKHHSGNITVSAQAAGMLRQNLQYMIKKHCIDLSRFKKQ